MKDLKKIFEKIPQERLVLYLLLLGIVPLLFLGSYLLEEKYSLSSLSEELSNTTFEVQSQNQRELANRSTRVHYQNRDQFYLIKQLESLQLQKEEITTLKKILDSGFHQEEDAIRARLQFLTSPDNCISFQEGPEKRMRNLRETELTLAHPVEASLEDIKTILTRVEGTKIDGNEADPSRPHLFFSDFRIEKKKVFSGEAYSLSFKVIKREYVS